MNPLITNILLFSVAATITTTAHALSQVCIDTMPQSAPFERFTISDDGSEVHDLGTGLTWQRCAVGRTWTGTMCEGTAMRLDWQSAVALGNNGEWRLPNIKELESIAEVSCAAPALNKTLFPGTPHSIFSRLWSATPYPHHETKALAWYFHPDSGTISTIDVTSEDFVRLVRD